MEFHTPLSVFGKRDIRRSVEWVHLHEPERIDFSQAYSLPEDKVFALDILEDSFVMTENGSCTLFRYESRFAAKAPVIGWLLANLLMRRVMGRHMDDHVLEIKDLCEARARRSRLFPQRECGHGVF